MREEDAEILYDSKIDWTAVYNNNKIYCAEPRCKFFTKIDREDLTMHTISNHNYGQFPCSDTNCDYIGYSKVRGQPYAAYDMPHTVYEIQHV